MRTLSLRIIVSFVIAFLLSAAAMLWISSRIARLTFGEFFEGSTNLELQRAQRIYESGGPSRLSEYLAETDAALKGKRYLTDAKGRDLVSGEDRSAMLSVRFDFLGFPKQENGQVSIVKSSVDGRYWLILVAPPPLGLGRFVPYFLSVALAIALLGWVLSAGIVSPLQRVANTVERFGRGDLSSRVECDRSDEIGALARSFNNMAERIQTLLTAERRLLQDVSHELRSPLARLGFAAELMKNAPDPEAAAGRMKQEIKRLTYLVSSLLELTTAEGDPSSRVVERFAIGTVLQPMLEDCAFEAEARGIRIEAEVSSSAIIDGDPELLRRAFENVLRNSIRYAPESSAVAVKAADSEDCVRITIRDHGPGVPEEALPHLFDPFFRADKSRDPATGNVGLGLAIARRAILIHHGEIAAENASPGLQVSILIPRVSAVAGTSPQ